MARDTQLDRSVAVKIPRKGELGPSETEQFVREARAAAQLKHPNIVAVHEVGREDGQVYIVSDYVEGLTLADWLVGQQLTSRTAAELCLKLAGALHHAHEAGVIHRDLKPTNIIIDRDNEPHIMDFGLAKREAGEITMTMEGKVLGTPAYMSPEQAKGEAHQADRRSDVYSLGVILYELLTGHKPFRGNVRMLLQQVITDDAPSPRRLNSSIPRDLETVCLKCLEKTPARRYQTAGMLAADLQHCLNKEPIAARPIGHVERGVRWCQRRPMVASLIGLVILATVGGFAGVTWQWRMAQANYAEAEKQREEADQQRERAEANSALAMEAFDEFFEQMSASWMSTPVELGEGQSAQFPPDSQAAAFLGRSLKFYERFAQQNNTDPRLLEAMAIANRRVGGIQRRLGRFEQAEEAYGEALRIWEQLAADLPKSTGNLKEVAVTRNELGVLLQISGRIDDAAQEFRNVIEPLEQLTKDQAPDTGLRFVLARAYTHLGQLQQHRGARGQAREYKARAVAMLKELVAKEPANTEFRLALARSYLALEVTQKSIEGVAILRELTTEFPAVPDYRFELATAYMTLGQTLRERGLEAGNRQTVQEAESTLRKAIKIGSELIDGFPNVPRYRLAIAAAHEKLAFLLLRTDRVEEAEQLHRQGLTIAGVLQKDFDDMPELHNYLGETHSQLARILSRRDDFEEAQRLRVQAIAHMQRFVDLDPDYTWSRFQLARELRWLGDVSRQLGQIAAAEQTWKNSTVIDVALVADLPTEHRYYAQCWARLGTTYLLLGNLCWANDRLSEAEEHYGKADELFDKRLPSELPVLWFLADCPLPQFQDVPRAVEEAQRAVQRNPVSQFPKTLLALAYYRRGEWKQAVVVLEKLPELEWPVGQALARFLLAMSYWNLGDKEEAQKSYDEAMQGLGEKMPDDVVFRAQLRRYRTEAAELLGVRP